MKFCISQSCVRYNEIQALFCAEGEDENIHVALMLTIDRFRLVETGQTRAAGFE